MWRALLLKDRDAALLYNNEKSLYAVLSFFFFALYVPGVSWLYNAGMWIVFAYCFFYNNLAEKISLLKRRPALLLMILFFLLNCISALFSDNIKEGVSWAGIRLSLLIFPISIGSLYIRSLLKDRIILSFSLAATLAAAGSLAWGAWRAVRQSDFSLLYNDNLSGILNLQSVYFALLINLAIFGYAYLLVRKSLPVKNFVMIPVFLLLAVVHFLLASRVAIIFLYSSVFIFAACLVAQKRKIPQGITLLLILLLGGFSLVKFFPKTINRFRELGYTQFDFKSQAKESHFNVAVTADQWNGANIRIAVWQCAWQVTQQHLLLGTGIGDKMDDLNKQYAKNGFQFGIKNTRNVHNNYLDTWMTMGLLGLVLLLAGFFVLPLCQCLKGRDWYGMIIVLSFAFSLVTETYMDRTVGNTFLAFFLSFIASYKKPNAGPSGY